MKKDLIHLEQRVALIQALPYFSHFSEAHCQKLAPLFDEVSFAPDENIVSEGALVDAIFIIVDGKAEVMNQSTDTGHAVETLVAVLESGECIGLNELGFYSTTGKRTATVVAITAMQLLRLDIQKLYQFLKENHLESAMVAASSIILKMALIKHSLPFSKLSYQRLHWLAERIDMVRFNKGAIIFNEGEKALACYLIHDGQVKIASHEKKNHSKQLALLSAPAVFGEATFITRTVRNATASAESDCELFVLKYSYLSELFSTDQDVSHAFMSLMINRSRPIQYPKVAVHRRVSADNQPIIILKHLDNHNYCKLSEEGLFIWEQLNGERSMQEITLNFSEKFNVFSPPIVASLISNLAKSGFVCRVPISSNHVSTMRPLWASLLLSIQHFFERQTIIFNANLWISTLYRRYLCYLFTTMGQCLLAMIVIVGAILFVWNTKTIVSFFSSHYENIFWVLGLIPLSWLTVIIHELGHAVTAKAFGRDVHYIGLGWRWFSPSIFIDTSDMWLSTRGPRLLVTVAGLYADILIAGLASIAAFVIHFPTIQGMLWLFACCTYLKVFSILNPAQETDGYYLLMDWLDVSNLRQSALIWLVNTLPRLLKTNPKAILKYRIELLYWSACIVFFTLMPIITWIVQSFIFSVFGIRSPNIYFLLIIPLVTTVLSGLSIIADIRHEVRK